MSIFSVISEISDSLKSPQEPHHHYSGRMHVHMDVSMELDVCETAFGNISINEFVYSDENIFRFTGKASC